LGAWSTSTVISSPEAGRAPNLSRKARAATTMAEPQVLVPDEPPATEAVGYRVSPIRTSTSATGTPSASAAI